MNIIVRMPNWVGDLVMATPVLLDLRKAYPNASITAMAREPISELLRNETAIDELFAFSVPENDFMRRQIRRDIIGKLRRGKYDIGILLTNSFSSAWWFRSGGVKRRIGYGGRLRGLLLTDRVERVSGQHQVEEYKELLKPLGIAQTDTAPRLIFTEEEKNKARELLRQQGYKQGAVLIGINPGATYGSAKCWPPERFRAMAIKLLEDRNLFLLCFGDATQVPLVREICRGLPERVIDVAGMTSLRELGALVGECSLLVTNDSGPMHMAAALQVPVVALFGSTDDRKTGPWGQQEAVIHKRVSCSPCFRRVCPIDFRCMREIGVDEVVAKIRSHVSHSSP